jgi:hypothetical protein
MLGLSAYFNFHHNLTVFYFYFKLSALSGWISYSETTYYIWHTWGWPCMAEICCTNNVEKKKWNTATRAQPLHVYETCVNRTDNSDGLSHRKFQLQLWERIWTANTAQRKEGTTRCICSIRYALQSAAVSVGQSVVHRCPHDITPAQLEALFKLLPLARILVYGFPSGPNRTGVLQIDGDK